MKKYGKNSQIWYQNNKKLFCRILQQVENCKGMSGLNAKRTILKKVNASFIYLGKYSLHLDTL